LNSNPSKSIRVDILGKLSNYLVKCKHVEFSMDKLEAKIKWIGHPLSWGVTDPRLPFRIDTANAVRVIAAMFNDGYIGKGGAKDHGAMHYYNENFALRSRVAASAVDAFGGDSDAYPAREHRGDHYVVFPSVIRDLMKQIGVPTGSKVNHNHRIPSLIYASEHPDLWRAWLRQAADDEGGIRFRPKAKSRHVYWRRCIGLSPEFSVEIEGQEKSFHALNDRLEKIVARCTPHLLIEEKELLERFGVSCKVRPLSVYKVKTGAYRAKWELYIGGRKNLDRFYRVVGFSHPQKNRLLEKALRSYKQLMDFKMNGFYTITPKVVKECSDAPC
jgi:hypothetical protein